MSKADRRYFVGNMSKAACAGQVSDLDEAAVVEMLRSRTARVFHHREARDFVRLDGNVSRLRAISRRLRKHRARPSGAYIIESANHQIYKIGMTTDLCGRLSSITLPRFGNPRLVAFIRCPAEYARWLEESLFVIYREQRIGDPFFGTECFEGPLRPRATHWKTWRQVVDHALSVA